MSSRNVIPYLQEAVTYSHTTEKVEPYGPNRSEDPSQSRSDFENEVNGRGEWVKTQQGVNGV